MTDAETRLAQYLLKVPDAAPSELIRLSPDASTREYFRIRWHDTTAIACVYPEPFVPRKQSYLDVTRLFLKSSVPVPVIHEFSGDAGVIIQEDLGDAVLSDVLKASDPSVREELLDEAIRLIPRIQNATKMAYSLKSVASKLKFDEEKLLWELNFFSEHYFRSLRKKELTGESEEELQREFRLLSRELETHASVLCHRDFHAANLMLDKDRRLRIIDHQDARIGSAAYDLVSLLLDRVLQPPDQVWLGIKKKLFFAERTRLGLEIIDSAAFDREFDLAAVQRCLKAIGTFSYQTAIRGKKGYTQYVEPMLRIVLESCERLGSFPKLQEIIRGELNEDGALFA